MMKICPVCGKPYDRTPEWGYKYKYTEVCSWKCLQQERENDFSAARITKNNRETVEITCDICAYRGFTDQGMICRKRKEPVKDNYFCGRGVLEDVK